MSFMSDISNKFLYCFKLSNSNCPIKTWTFTKKIMAESIYNLWDLYPNDLSQVFTRKWRSLHSQYIRTHPGSFRYIAQYRYRRISWSVIVKLYITAQNVLAISWPSAIILLSFLYFLLALKLSVMFRGCIF